MKVVFAFTVNAVFNFIIGLLIARFLGPDEYGRFAIILTTGLVIQVAFFDWLRLAAIRFYSEKAHVDYPEIRRTLDICFSFLAVFFISLSVMVLAFNFDVKIWNIRFTKEMAALALSVAVVNEFFDYTAALVRARFLDKLYNAVIIAKNLLSIGLTTFAAYHYRSAEMAMVGAIVSLFGATYLGQRGLRQNKGVKSAFNAMRAKAFFLYSSPIIAANVLYLLVPYANRILVANFYGYSEVGHFSLPFDLGQRALLAVGSAMDVLLFQIAVRVRDTQGEEKAKEQIARNFMLIFAVLAPTCVGVTLVLPSIVALIVPADYRASFSHYFILMQPGLLAFALINFGLNPVFQIEKKTSPLILAAFIGSVCAPIFAVLTPRGTDAGGLAIAQSAAYIAAFFALTFCVAKTQPCWPKGKDFMGVLIALTGMSAVLWPLRGLAPSAATLMLQVFLGALAYGSLALTLNIGDVRTSLIKFIAQRRDALQPE